mmetsp:Transcript_21545/g.82002  ORF Transcript_21545/g.82002 Transcript_21545/m.82002 type:complete len:258 (+) Transcript_21545:238-1011(+)
MPLRIDAGGGSLRERERGGVCVAGPRDGGVGERRGDDEWRGLYGGRGAVPVRAGGVCVPRHAVLGPGAGRHSGDGARVGGVGRCGARLRVPRGLVAGWLGRCDGSGGVAVGVSGVVCGSGVGGAAGARQRRHAGVVGGSHQQQRRGRVVVDVWLARGHGRRGRGVAGSGAGAGGRRVGGERARLWLRVRGRAAVPLRPGGGGGGVGERGRGSLRDAGRSGRPRRGSGVQQRGGLWAGVGVVRVRERGARRRSDSGRG